ncbi:MAG: hypothetical protein KBT22_04545 [Bacteroidales bacterium]|nr:hypothetical protein [Candidatus Scybalocola fimicaballi]
MEWQLDDKTNVLVLAKPEKCVNYKWYENADKIDSRLQLLPIEYVDSNNFPCQLNKDNGLTEGMMLIRHPYIKDSFIDVTRLEDEILELKLQAMKTIGLKLGAKEIHIKSSLKTSELRDFHVGAEASGWKVNVKGDVETNKSKYEANEYRIDWTGNSTSMTVDSFNEAKDIAKKYGLYSEPRIATLFDDRNPDHPATGTFSVFASAMKESNERLNVAVSASYLSAFSFKAGVANSCTLKNEITLETTFTF